MLDNRSKDKQIEQRDPPVPLISSDFLKWIVTLDFIDVKHNTYCFGVDTNVGVKNASYDFRKGYSCYGFQKMVKKS